MAATGTIFRALVLFSAVVVLAGTILMWRAVADDNVAALISAYNGRDAHTQSSYYFLICFFWFSLISSVVAGVTKHALFALLSAGLIANIFTDSFPLQTVDVLRILNSQPGASANPIAKTLEEYFAGSVLSYFGVLTAFLAALYVQRHPLADQSSQPKVARILAGVAVLFTAVGCITLWTSSAISLKAGGPTAQQIRYQIFQITEVGTASTFLTVAGVAFGVWGVAVGSVFFSGFNLYILARYLDMKDALGDQKDQVLGGAALVWIGLIVNCITAFMASNTAARGEYTSI